MRKKRGSTSTTMSGNSVEEPNNEASFGEQTDVTIIEDSQMLQREVALRPNSPKKKVK